MKTRITFVSHYPFQLGLLALMAFLFAASPVHAGLSLTMEISHEVDKGFPPFFSTNYQLLIYDVEPTTNLPAAPSGYYVISSPTAMISEGFQLSSGGISNYTGGSGTEFADYNSFIQELTNGNWSISVSNGASVTNYTFQMSAPGFTSNTLPDVNITFPSAGAANVTNNPTFTWQGISWGSGNIQVQVTGSPSGFREQSVLSTSQTSWPNPATLPEGDNTLFVTYAGGLSSNVTASVPVDNLSHPISAFTFQAFLDTYAVQAFSVTNHSPAKPSSTPLVAHYTFDDGSVAATDSSGNTNDLAGAYSYSGGSVTITNDALEGAYAASFYSQFGFSGGDYYTDNTNLLSALAGDFSVSLWLKTTQIFGNDSDAGIFNGAGIISAFAFNSPSTTNYVIPMALTGHKLAFVTVGGGGAAQDTLHSVTSVDTGSYVHVVVTRDHNSGAKKIYVNGGLDAFDTGATGLLNGSPFLQIGLKNGQGYNGNLDDIQFYSTALSSAQILQLYQHPGSTAYTNAGSGPSLAVALNATNVTWTTDGDANWFGETATTYDGVSAAQSGAISDDQVTWLQTTALTNGQVSFYWKVSSEETFDFLRFFIDGVQQDAISGEVDWAQKTYSVSAGATLRWQYDKDGGGSDGSDTAWVDQVQFTTNAVSNAPVSVGMSVSIERYNDQINGSPFYYAYADINFIDPPPVTTNRLESADGMIYSEVFAGDNSEDTSGVKFAITLDDAIYACTNGQWKLYINKGSPNEQVFYFNLSVGSLTTNYLGSVQMLVPAPHAVNVASNSPIQWSGPTNASSIFVEAYQPSPIFTFDGYTNLLATATNWPSPPSLLTGTNNCFVQYSYYNFTDFSFTTPVDGSLNPIAVWSPAFYLYSVAGSSFSVRSPLAVQINSTPPASSGGNFQLSFQTVPGHTEIVQMRTNLFTGTWADVTNFVGDGSGYQLAVPITNSPGKYFRVITQ